MRTKEEIADILAKRGIGTELTKSTWSDLVTAIQGYSQAEKDKFVKLVINSDKRVINLLHNALLANAEQRSRANIDVLLSDDSLTLAEIDSLLV